VFSRTNVYLFDRLFRLSIFVARLGDCAVMISLATHQTSGVGADLCEKNPSRHHHETQMAHTVIYPWRRGECAPLQHDSYYVHRRLSYRPFPPLTYPSMTLTHHMVQYRETSKGQRGLKKKPVDIALDEWQEIMRTGAPPPVTA
jgi:hypothetical protein